MRLLSHPPAPEREPRAASAPNEIPARAGWKDRLDDPLNRFYRYPLARVIARRLLPTRITPNEVSFVQPLLAAAAGWLVTFTDRRLMLLAALLFELRSILDCVDGTLARMRRSAAPGGHAVDAVADWLGTALFYAGIVWRFHAHPPPAGGWLSVDAVLALALAQAAVRSFAADYYKAKLVGIFELGRDETVEALRRKVRALGLGAPPFARIDVAIGRIEHLVFAHHRFDPDAPADADVARVKAREGSPLARAVAVLWSVSNGDAFLSMMVLSLAANRLWEAQVFFAIAGFPWILAVIALSGRLVRR